MKTALLQMVKSAGLAPPPKHQEKLDEHFSSFDDKKWRIFKRNLRSRAFVNAVMNDERSDDKLKRFAEMTFLHQNGRGPKVLVPGSGTKPHTVKFHPKLDRYTCSCGDWTYVKSLKPVDQADCKHITQVKSQSEMVKRAASAWLMKQVGGLGRVGLMAARKETNEEQAWHAGAINRAHQRVRQERMKKQAEIRGLAAKSLLELMS